jgi:hypothetical protein
MLKYNMFYESVKIPKLLQRAIVDIFGADCALVLSGTAYNIIMGVNTSG